MFRNIGLLIVAIMLLAGVLLASVSPANAAEPETGAAQAAVDYIISLQNADGGFPAFGADSAPGSTIDAVFALVAAGVDVESVTANGNSPMDYLATQAAGYSTDPGAAAKLALVLYVVPNQAQYLTDFGGANILQASTGGLDPATGMYGLDLFDHAFYILAGVEFFAGNPPANPDLQRYLRAAQLEDGGWEFGEGFGSDSNTTALALQALLAAEGGADEVAATASVASALGYLHTAQNADGGFGYLTDSESDPNSTALVIQALAAAGEDIDAGGPWASDGVTPLEALLAFQNPETGAFQFAGEDSPFATYQAVPGLLLAPFPGLQPMLLPGSETPVASPTMAVESVETPEPAAPPADLPKVGTGASSDGSPWLVAALAAGGLAAIGAGAFGRDSGSTHRRRFARHERRY